VFPITHEVNGQVVVDVPGFVGIVKSHCRFGLYYKIVPASGVGGGMTLPPTMIEGRVHLGKVEKPGH